MSVLWWEQQVQAIQLSVLQGAAHFKCSRLQMVRVSGTVNERIWTCLRRGMSAYFVLNLCFFLPRITSL